MCRMFTPWSCICLQSRSPPPSSTYPPFSSAGTMRRGLTLGFVAAAGDGEELPEFSSRRALLARSSVSDSMLRRRSLGTPAYGSSVCGWLATVLLRSMRLLKASAAAAPKPSGMARLFSRFFWLAMCSVMQASASSGTTSSKRMRDATLTSSSRAWLSGTCMVQGANASALRGGAFTNASTRPARETRGGPAGLLFGSTFSFTFVDSGMTLKFLPDTARPRLRRNSGRMRRYRIGSARQRSKDRQSSFSFSVGWPPRPGKSTMQGVCLSARTSMDSRSEFISTDGDRSEEVASSSSPARKIP
mmetsp:Transcript_13817/g.51553  ORF Transcript_13817/g.51553 Transcript_13817/m.51553 type:complete len:302 (+) Transcript_13817:3384-4289(+)